MDISQITSAMSSLNAAKELASAAIGVRDFNQVAQKLSALNNELLKVQDSLFQHNAQLMEMQQRENENQAEIRRLSAQIALQGQYDLHQLSEGVIVYKATTSPQHYVCQPCFDKGIRAILVRRQAGRSVSHRCPECETIYPEIIAPAQALDYPGQGFY